MKLWKENKRKDIKKLIDHLLAVCVDGAWPVDFLNKVAIRELCASSHNSDLNVARARKVLTQMSRSNKAEIEDFELIFQQLMEGERSSLSSQSNEWLFFVPWNVKLANDVRRSLKIQLLGHNFSILRRGTVAKKVDSKTRKGLEDPSKVPSVVQDRVKRIPETFIYCSVRAVDRRTAWAQIEPALDALRGLTELTLNLFSFRPFDLVPANEFRPLGDVHSPNWVLSYCQGVGGEWARLVGGQHYEKEDLVLLDQSLIKKIKLNARILRKEVKRKSTVFLITNCLRLYWLAMNASPTPYAFLGFWQLAEAITLSETTHGHTDTVVNRLYWHSEGMGLIGSGYKDTLTMLGKKRNDLVHRGIHDIAIGDIDILKIACESALSWLYKVHKALPTETHLNRFFSLRDQNELDHAANKAAIQYIKKAKERAKK